MKKILIVNYEYPPLGGGAGVVSQKYAEGLEGLGNQVTVVTTWFEGEKEFEKKGNLEIYRLKSLRRKAFQSNPIEMLSWAFESIKFLQKFLKNNNFDICISFFSIPGGIVAKYINEKFKIPYIISTHGADIPGFYPEKMKKFHILTNWYARKIWKKAEKILVLTSEMRKLAEKFGFQEKIMILPNGCNADLFYPDFSKKENKRFELLFVGRLCEEKDIFTMLNSIKYLNEKNVDFHVNIIGDGPLRWEMEKFIEQNSLKEKISVLGWLDKNELREYYQKSHIQICSSKVEAMSIAILESLFSGLYILSTPISGNTDMIEEGVNGEFFEIGDYEKLGEKLLYWSQNFAKIPFHKEKNEELKKIYNWENIIDNLDEILQNNIKKNV